MKIAIAGGTGFLGQTLVQILQQRGDEVFILTRKEDELKNGVHYVQWLSPHAKPEQQLDGIDAFINLAGISLNDGRWTEQQKKRIYDSRMNATDAAYDILEKLQNRPSVYVSASAVGIYPISRSAIYTEASTEIADDFLGKTVQDWEAHASQMETLGIRTCFARLGVLLGKNGGALPRITLPYKLFAGGTVGSGEQWISWVHVQDAARAILYMIDHPTLNGPFNVTSPNVKNMKQFGKIVGEVLKKPHWLPVPAFALKLALGEQSTLVLDGQYVLPEKLLKAGFTFEFASLTDALTNIYR